MNELSNVFNQELQKLHNLKNEQISTISTEIEENQVTEKLMTTKELASVLGVSERTIRDTAKNKGVEGTFHTLKTKGGTQSVKVYTEEQATLIKQEIQKHHNLVSRQIDTVSTEIEENQVIENALLILRNREAELKQKLQNAEAIIAEQKPKVEFYDCVTRSDNAIDMAEVAKVLNCGLGRNQLFALLRSKHILDNKNQPYQQYVKSGYFKIVESKKELSDGSVIINLKTVVFQKGLDFIRKVTKSA